MFSHSQVTINYKWTLDKKKDSDFWSNRLGTPPPRIGSNTHMIST